MAPPVGCLGQHPHNSKVTGSCSCLATWVFSSGLFSLLTQYPKNGMKAKESINGSQLHLSKQARIVIPTAARKYRLWTQMEKKKDSFFAVCAPLWLIQLMPLEMSVSGCSGGLTLNSKAPTWYLSLQGRVGPFSSPTLGQQGKDAIRKHLFVTYMNNRKILRSCRCRFCIFCNLTRKRFALFCCPGWALRVLTVRV